jgi:hypothetical protein
MRRFLLRDEVPQPAEPCAPGAVRRGDAIEVDPRLMAATPPQWMPRWDRERIAANRVDHIAWVREQFTRPGG